MTFSGKKFSWFMEAGKVKSEFFCFRTQKRRQESRVLLLLLTSGVHEHTLPQRYKIPNPPVTSDYALFPLSRLLSWGFDDFSLP